MYILMRQSYINQTDTSVRFSAYPVQGIVTKQKDNYVTLMRVHVNNVAVEKR